MSTRFALLVVPAALLIAVSSAPSMALAQADDPAPAAGEAAEHGGIDAPAAFERLKSLVGTWEGREGEYTAQITYRLSGNGSTVVETFFPGQDHEMISVYHLDGDDLRMTHYCAIGNQPRLVLDRAASTADELVFAFDGGTNLDPATDIHIHEGRILLLDADTILGEWTAFQDNKPAGTTPFKMNRVKE